MTPNDVKEMRRLSIASLEIHDVDDVYAMETDALLDAHFYLNTRIDEMDETSEACDIGPIFAEMGLNPEETIEISVGELITLIGSKIAQAKWLDSLDDDERERLAQFTAMLKDTIGEISEAIKKDKRRRNN